MSTGSISRRAALFTGAAVAAAADPLRVPTVRFGEHTISRLMPGGNPVSGHSHVDGRLSQEMIDYFTVANVKKMLGRCEELGVNVWQSRGDAHILRVLHEYRQEGGKIHWIAQTATEMGNIPAHIRRIAALEKPIGIYNHGNNTDGHYAAKTLATVREQCKVMRDCGVRVGVGTHNPEVIDAIESQDWDVDFYMTCLYNLTRSREEVQRLAGPKHQGEFFHDADRERMLERVRKTKRQCLIFKVYGATRHCGSVPQMQAALRLVFQYAKPEDALVIGMFPKHKDQVLENCRLVAEAAKTAQS